MNLELSLKQTLKLTPQLLQSMQVLQMSTQELADYLCVERAAMSAELSRLQKQGLLTTNKNHFILQSVPDDVNADILS